MRIHRRFHAHQFAGALLVVGVLLAIGMFWFFLRLKS